MMNKSTVFMFSGQGTQYYHMGKELYEHHPRFKLWMDHCDEIVSPLIHTSLIGMLYKQDNKNQLFERILYTNPALISVGFSLSRVLMEMGIKPDYVLGYSLGEITAAIVSGAISLEDGLSFSVDFARLVESSSPAGGMLAIIDSIDLMTDFPEIFEDCWLAGNNFQRNFVVAGLANNIQSLYQQLIKRQIVCQKLPVNYGFHTPLMEPLEQLFKQHVGALNIAKGRIPVVSSLKAQIIEDIDEDHLWQLIRHSVEFEKTINFMLEQKNLTFIDVGPSGSLASSVKYLLPPNSTSTHMEVMNQFGRNLQSLTKLKENFAVNMLKG
ncbi:acyltransferase domain-containing protein [Colwelliaceae bacterium 6441]